MGARQQSCFATCLLAALAPCLSTCWIQVDLRAAITLSTCQWTSKMVGFGYAFVNATCPKEALRMWEYFEGQNLGEDNGTPCEVSWGEPLHGLAAHIDRYRNSPVM